MTAQTAADLLGTSTRVLSMWEQRFGYPVPVRAADGECSYPDHVMIALRDALSRELSIASAITRARRVQVKASARSRQCKPAQNSEEAR